MLLFSKVAFVVGDINLPSSKVRGIQIAERLGASVIEVSKLDFKTYYDLIVTIKTDIDVCRLKSIASKVVNTVIDYVPTIGYDGYIVESEFAKSCISWLDNVHVIRQHSCNYNNDVSVAGKDGPVVWIGGYEWFPAGLPDYVDCLFVNKFTDINVIRDKYLNSGIILNLRRNFDNSNPNELFIHRCLNGGIKLINSISYKIPSLTSGEPYIDEIGRDCTVVCNNYSNLKTYINNVKDNYEMIRSNCFNYNYHIDETIIRYENVLRSIYDK